MIRFSLTIAALALSAVLDAQSQRAPNVVLIMMDDLGYGDLGSYGGTDARTPHIDGLARDGVRLTDAYANGAVCTPTRVALMTGRYQQRAGLEWILTASPTDRDRGLPALPTSLPALLRTNGYATALIGKWHLGVKREYGPNAHGFDEFYGFLSGAHSYHSNRAHVAIGGPGEPDLFENTTPVEATGYLTDEISRRAVGFITRQAERPFFLEVSYNAPHWPFEPPGRAPTAAEQVAGRAMRQMPDDSVTATRLDYVRVLERADDGVGAILAALRRHKLTENTLVIFTNDNGGEWLSRNAPLFHRKGTLWEGGIRVPLIMRWPGQLPSGTVSPQVAITMDITASILAVTRTHVPEAYRPDGMDIIPALRGTVPLPERRLFWRNARPDRQQRAVRDGRWKLLIDANQLLLFDLSVDPGERTDLVGQHPDVAASLKRLVAAWEANVDARSGGR